MSQPGTAGGERHSHAVQWVMGLGLMGSPPPALADDSPQRARTNPSLPRTETSTSTKPMGEMVQATRALWLSPFSGTRHQPLPISPSLFSINPLPQILLLYHSPCRGVSTLLFFLSLLFLAQAPPMIYSSDRNELHQAKRSCNPLKLNSKFIS